jgi:hypothetical protein
MSVPTPEQFTAYEQVPSQLTTALQGISESHMHYSPAPDEWSIHQVIIHLADSEAIGYWRLRKTIAEPGSTLAVYDQPLWARQLSYATQSRNLALSLFASLRASSAALLRALPANTWELTSIHPERGVMSLYDVFLLYLSHGDAHLQQIANIKQVLPATV